MKDLLYLVHRIPYPPNKGDKIRSYNILKKLSESYRVHLGAFIDDSNDWQYVDEVKQLCAETCFLTLNPNTAKLKSLKGLLVGQPLTVPYYNDSKMKQWVRDVMSRFVIERSVIFSSSMAQYVEGDEYSQTRRILDFVDIDSDKWLQYSLNKSWPMNWVYRREGNRLGSVESKLASIFDASIFVSHSEAALFKELCPSSAQSTHFINNGVNSDYFSPEHALESPYSADAKVLVFTGAMDYWANVESVSWFAHDIFPRIREEFPDAKFYIVGSNPDKAVQNLASHDGVFVTGSVPDIRPYVLHAAASVAPLRIARGVQNKVLEAMAMAKPVLASPAAIEGIDYTDSFDELLCKSEDEFVGKALKLLNSPDAHNLGQALRTHVISNYNWDVNLGRLSRLIEGEDVE